MKRFALIAVLALAGCKTVAHPVTFYLPDAQQDSQPFCLSNRSDADINLPDGQKVHPGQMVRASVVVDFQWGFGYPEPATKRADVDCFVIAK